MSGRAKVLWVKVVHGRVGACTRGRPPAARTRERRLWSTSVEVARVAGTLFPLGSAGNTTADGDTPLPLAGWVRCPRPVGWGLAGTGILGHPRQPATRSNEGVWALLS